MRVYMDHNATTPLAAGVAQAMAAAAEVAWGNPSSVHAEGRAARDAVEAARRRLAGALGGAIEDIVFTSGGTEADVLGVAGLAHAGPVASSRLEHPAVLGALGEGAILLDADADGRLEASAVDRAVAAGAGVLTVQLANHELGTVQDVARLAAEARAAGLLVHCDAVQALGKIAIDVTALGVDTLAISGHKIGGPKGAGALWIRPGAPWRPPAGQAGHQERGRRGGTEAVLALVGLGAAVDGLPERLAAAPRVRSLAAALESGLRERGARIHGAGAPRVGNTVNAGFEDAPGEIVVTALDLAGIAVSTGAACTSGTVAPSPVLQAIGLSPAHASEAIRFSLGPENTEADVEVALEVLPAIVARARRFASVR